MRMHEFTCHVCGRAFTATGADLDAWRARVAADQGHHPGNSLCPFCRDKSRDQEEQDRREARLAAVRLVNEAPGCRGCGVKVVQRWEVEWVRRFLGEELGERVDHHVDYHQDVTVPVCRACHAKIHSPALQSPEIELLRPVGSRAELEERKRASAAEERQARAAARATRPPPAPPKRKGGSGLQCFKCGQRSEEGTFGLSRNWICGDCDRAWKAGASKP